MMTRSGSEVSSYWFQMTAETTIGAKTSNTVPTTDDTRAFQFHSEWKRPSDRAVIRPNKARLTHQIQSDPPSVPVYSYHWTSPTVPAKPLPRTSQGQEIWATVR